MSIRGDSGSTVSLSCYVSLIQGQDAVSSNYENNIGASKLLFIDMDRYAGI